MAGWWGAGSPPAMRKLVGDREEKPQEMRSLASRAHKTGHTGAVGVEASETGRQDLT